MPNGLSALVVVSPRGGVHFAETPRELAGCARKCGENFGSDSSQLSAPSGVTPSLSKASVANIWCFLYQIKQTESKEELISSNVLRR